MTVIDSTCKPAEASDSDHIYLEVIRETPAAYMVFNPDMEEVAIPKSQILDLDEDTTTEHDDGEETRQIAVKLPQWLIEQGNLI